LRFPRAAAKSSSGFAFTCLIVAFFSRRSLRTLPTFHMAVYMLVFDDFNSKGKFTCFLFLCYKKEPVDFSTNSIYCRAQKSLLTLGGFFFGSRIKSSFQYVLYNIVIKTTLIFLFHTDGLNQMHHEVHLMPS